MGKPIPAPLIAVVSDLVSSAETHASLNSLFMYAEASGEPPEGSKHVKAQEWLRNTNKRTPTRSPSWARSFVPTWKTP